MSTQNEEPTIDILFTVKVWVRASRIDPLAIRKAEDDLRTLLEKDGYSPEISHSWMETDWLKEKV